MSTQSSTVKPEDEREGGDESKGTAEEDSNEGSTPAVLFADRAGSEFSRAALEGDHDYDNLVDRFGRTHSGLLDGYLQSHK